MYLRGSPFPFVIVNSRERTKTECEHNLWCRNILVLNACILYIWMKAKCDYGIAYISPTKYNLFRIITISNLLELKKK